MCRRRCIASLCKALSDTMMQNMPAPSSDSEQGENTLDFYFLCCCGERLGVFFFLLALLLLFLCLRQVFGFSVLPKLFPGLSPAIRQSDSSETLQDNKFKC